MLPLDSPEELPEAFIRTRRALQPGLELVLLRDHHAILLANTLDSRVVDWNCEWFVLFLMPISSVKMRAPIDFSILAMVVTLWESALRGAAYSNVTEFFDFFDKGTLKWLQAALATNVIHVLLNFQGHLINAFPPMELEHQGLRTYCQYCLDTGLNTVEQITLLSPALDLSAGHPSFEAAKRFLFANWPDDPYKAFVSPERLWKRGSTTP